MSHGTSHDSWTTYDYDVALALPAGPAARTVAHDPARDFQRFSQGDKISVLVDPRQPGYAELPGIPVESSWWFIVPSALAVIFLAPVVLIVIEEIRHRRRRPAGMLPAPDPSHVNEARQSERAIAGSAHKTHGHRDRP